MGQFKTPSLFYLWEPESTSFDMLYPLLSAYLWMPQTWSICKTPLQARCPAIKVNCEKLASKFISENRAKICLREQRFFNSVSTFHTRTLWCKKKSCNIRVHEETCPNNWLIHCWGLEYESHTRNGVLWLKWEFTVKTATIQKQILPTPCI